MSKIRGLRPVWMACAVAGVLGAGGSAWAATLPPAQNQGPVAYVSGGVGQDEAKAFEAQAARWPVELEFVTREPGTPREAFLANVAVRILDAHDSVVLDTRSDGPFMLARLQPGRYRVQASFAGQTMTRTLRLGGQGTAHELFVWPGSAEHAES
ncbi:MAG: carboxypeptidase-like regulatory domain-containing protein [Rubrivivax sp.]